MTNWHDIADAGLRLIEELRNELAAERAARAEENREWEQAERLLRLVQDERDEARADLTTANTRIRELQGLMGDVAASLNGPAFAGDQRLSYLANRLDAAILNRSSAEGEG